MTHSREAQSITGATLQLQNLEASGQEVDGWCSSMFSPLCAALGPSPRDGPTHIETSSSPLS